MATSEQEVCSRKRLQAFCSPAFAEWKSQLISFLFFLKHDSCVNGVHISFSHPSLAPVKAFIRIFAQT